MKELTKEELDTLEFILNQETYDYLMQGYGRNHEHVIEMRSIMKKLGVKETYPYDELFEEEGDE